MKVKRVIVCMDTTNFKTVISPEYKTVAKVVGCSINTLKKHLKTKRYISDYLVIWGDLLPSGHAKFETNLKQ